MRSGNDRPHVVFHMIDRIRTHPSGQGLLKFTSELVCRRDLGWDRLVHGVRAADLGEPRDPRKRGSFGPRDLEGWLACLVSRVKGLSGMPRPGIFGLSTIRLEGCRQIGFKRYPLSLRLAWRTPRQSVVLQHSLSQTGLDRTRSLLTGRTRQSRNGARRPLRSRPPALRGCKLLKS